MLDSRLGPAGRHRRRPPHAVRQERHRLPGRLRGGAGPPRRARAARPHRARRPRGGRGGLRPGHPLGAGAQRRPRGEPPAPAPAERPRLHPEPRLRLRGAGHHQRRRPDRPRATPTWCSPAASSRSPTSRSCTRGASARSWSRRARPGASGARLGGLRPGPAARPGPGDARRSPSPRPARSMGQSAEKMAKENGISREAQDRLALHEPPARRRRHRRRPADRRDRALVRRPRAWTRSITERQRHPRRHVARGAGPAEAGVRPAVRLGHRRQRLAAHRRRRAPCCSWRRRRRSALGYEPLAYIRSYAVAAVDPGLAAPDGPGVRGAQGARARRHRLERSRPGRDPRGLRRPGALQRAGLGLEGVGRAAGPPGPVGEVDWERTNVMGGSIAIGHPVRRHRRAARHHARERDAAPRRPVRPDLDLRAGRDGLAMVLERESDVSRASPTVRSRPTASRSSRSTCRASRSTSSARAVEASSRRCSSGSATTPAVRAVVLISGKPDNFIAGADIEEFTALTTQAEAERAEREGQEMINRLETLPQADRRRDPRRLPRRRARAGARLRLPDRHRSSQDPARPARGAARPHPRRRRLPAAAAADRRCAPRSTSSSPGKSERAAKAFRLGLVDELVPPSILREVARRRGRPAGARRAARHAAAARRRRGLLLDRNPLGRAAGLSQGAEAGAQEDRRPLSGAARRARGGAGRAGARDRGRARRGAPRSSASWRSATSPASWCRSSSPRPRSRRTTACRPAARHAAPGPPARRRRRRLHGRRDRGHRGAQRRGGTRLKDTELAEVGQGPQGAPPRCSSDRLKRRRLTRPQYERLSGAALRRRPTTAASRAPTS